MSCRWSLPACRSTWIRCTNTQLLRQSRQVLLGILDAIQHTLPCFHNHILTHRQISSKLQVYSLLVFIMSSGGLAAWHENIALSMSRYEGPFHDVQEAQRDTISAFEEYMDMCMLSDWAAEKKVLFDSALPDTALPGPAGQLAAASITAPYSPSQFRSALPAGMQAFPYI